MRTEKEIREWVVNKITKLEKELEVEDDSEIMHCISCEMHIMKNLLRFIDENN